MRIRESHPQVKHLSTRIADYVSGQGDYQATRAQTGAEYVAVAAFTDDETGPVSELYLPWDTLAPVSPPDQYVSEPLTQDRPWSPCDFSGWIGFSS